MSLSPGASTHTMGSRRGFLRTLAAIGAGAACRPSRSQAQITTHTYKSADGLAIRADVHLAEDDRVRPIAVWIHGGALIMGRRQGVPQPLMDRLIEAGFTVVSIDYRLAPETKLAAIIEDVEDAFAWIRGQGPDLFRADPDRIAVLGSSAGGYLTLTAGHRVDPRPQALVSFWGYGDLIGPWYSTPSPHHRHRRIVMTREQALAQVSGPPIANSADRDGNGGAFYQHCRQHGIWPKEVSGWNPVSEAEMFIPYMPLRNVTPSYPPTLLVHGTADTDVPYEQSTLMAEEFRRHGVRHELLTFEGAEHGIGGSSSAESDRAYSAAVAFLQAEIGV